MKKILAIVLCLAMVLSMTACFGKDDVSEADPTISQTDDATQEQNATESTAPIHDEDDETHGKDKESHDEECNDPSHDHDIEVMPIDPAEKQAMWEQVFANGELVVNADSMKLLIADMLSMQVLSDDENQYVEIAAADDSMGVALYRRGEDVYCKQYGPDEDGVLACEWYVCEFPEDMENAEVSIMDSAETSVIDAAELMEMLKNIESMKYVGTEDGLDNLVLICVDTMNEVEELPESNWVTTFDATLEVEYNGVVGQFRYTTQTNGGSGSSRGCHWESDEEPLEDILDWEFDQETLTLAKDDEVLQCTLIEDHLLSDDDENSGLIEVRIQVNPTTCELVSMSFEVDGEVGAIQFINCDSVDEYIELPDNIEETIPAEEAAMSLMMIIFAIAMGE